MQRIINDPFHVVEDAISGYLKAYPNYFAKTENPRVLKFPSAPIRGKVGVVSGGGSGHEPAFLGYVGHQLLDAVAVGEIFSSPTAKAFFDAFREADGGKGVACLFGNYAGDQLNVKMACQLAELDGIPVKTVVANDDVASAPNDQRNKRRGVAGEILMWKTGGAKAALGGSLDEVIAVAQRTVDQTRSIGVGLSSCVLPAVGKENFAIKAGTMEIGIGHHGEPGVAVTNLKSAKEIASLALEQILPDLPFDAGMEVVVIVSGLGGTPVMELAIAYDTVAALLEEAGITVHRAYVGNYFTSLEMRGITFTLMKLDDELKELIDLDCDSLGLTQIRRSG
jgi:phosphoenolpyruvate---glycerone phosphotransferase subunit DhaK